jgi:hypothetical protein
MGIVHLCPTPEQSQSIFAFVDDLNMRRFYSVSIELTLFGTPAVIVRCRLIERRLPDRDRRGKIDPTETFAIKRLTVAV